ncbi:MAG TPA: hypothetical protein GX743_02975 [Actinomycetales bacterium]|nr:hypothetical protein [Actinomycetales bacterium]
MNILIAVGSRSGWTQSVAEWIADEIRTAGHTVTLSPAADAPAPSTFDATFVGAGIRAGNWNKDAARYLSTHAAALATTPLVTFISCLGASGPSPKAQAEVASYTTEALKKAGATAVFHGSHTGGYDPQRVSLPERLIMRAIRQHAPVDLRDEERVRTWTREALAALTQPRPLQ